MLSILLAASAFTLPSAPLQGALAHASSSTATTVAAAPRFLAPLMQEDTVTATPAAFIEFIEGVPEPVVPDVSLTRSRDGSTGVATFTFDNPSFLSAASEALGETTGMYLKDSEGTMKTSEVTATFTNGKPRFVKGIYVMKDNEEWDRFMRFMERYAESNGLGFSKA